MPVLLAISTTGWVLRVGIGLLVVLVIYLVGASLIRQFTQEPIPEPDPEATVAVDLRFRCTVCGAEVTMTSAQDEEPEAPRHCREDMVLVPPVS